MTALVLVLATLGAPDRPTATLLRPLELASTPGSLAPNLSDSSSPVLLSWLEPIGDPVTSHRLRVARLGPAGFEGPTTVLESNRIFANWADLPSVTAAPDGSILAHFAEKSASDPYAYDVQLALLAKGSRTFRRLGPAHDDATRSEHGFVSVLPTGPSEFRLIWLDGRAANQELGAMSLRTAVVSASGVNRSEVVDDRVCDCCGTSAAATKQGPLVVYRDRTESEVRDISVSRRVGGTWTPPKPIHEDRWKIAGCPVNGPAVDARGDTVVVAWFTGAPRPGVRVAFSHDSGATFGGPIVVDETLPHVEGRVDIVLADDAAIVSWLAGTEESVSQLWVRRVRADGARGDAVAVLSLSSARASGFPRMARRSSELFFTWTDAGPPSRVRAGVLPLWTVPEAVQPPAASTPAPAPLSASGYAAQTLEAKPVALASLRGRVVFLNLWATWCEPCRREEPELVKLRNRFGPRGLTVVGVSMDEAGAIEAVRAHARKSAAFDSTWHDPGARGMTKFRVPALPASFLLDRTGGIVWSRLGAVSESDPELREAIEMALSRAI